MKDNQEHAIWTAVVMLSAIVAIVFMVCVYKHCEANDTRIQECLSNGHHTAQECKEAYRL